MKPARTTVPSPVRDAAPARSLGPAEVLEGDARAVRVRLADGSEVSAELALALSYEPAKGDVVLVIGEAGTYYGIGVLRGKGRLLLESDGDIAVRAGGTLELSGSRVRMVAQEAEFLSAKMTMVGEVLTQRVSSLLQRVSSLLTVHAKQVNTVVEESTVTQAKNATILTEDAVTINGKSVLLG
jgi:hypothetical protein